MGKRVNKKEDPYKENLMRGIDKAFDKVEKMEDNDLTLGPMSESSAKQWEEMFDSWDLKSTMRGVPTHFLESKINTDITKEQSTAIVFELMKRDRTMRELNFVRGTYNKGSKFTPKKKKR